MMSDETIAQRQKGFKKLIDSFEHLSHEASRDRVESLIFLAGTSVNEDISLSYLHTSGAMETVSHVFFFQSAVNPAHDILVLSQYASDI